MSSSIRSPLAADAVAGVTDAGLVTLVGDHWELMMAWMPTWATTLGDHRFDHLLVRRDPATMARYAAARDALLSRVRALDATALGAEDRITHAMLLAKLVAEQALDVGHFHEWSIDSGGAGLFGELSYMVDGDLHAVKGELTVDIGPRVKILVGT